MERLGGAAGRALARWVFPVPFGFVVAASLVLLFSPAGTEPPPFPLFDKLVHATLFALLALTGRVARLPVTPLAAGLLCYAVGSEALQGVLPIGRAASGWDALADLTGAAAGLAVAGLAAYVSRRGRRPVTA